MKPVNLARWDFWQVISRTCGSPVSRIYRSEEIRYDLHRFFSLRSSAGQAAAAMYRLDKWASEIKDARNIEAKVYVDIAEPGLTELVRGELQQRLNVKDVKVETGSLHAGTQCCEKLPALHYQEPGYAFHQGTPAFQEDIVIPWEGTRLINAVKGALPKLKTDAPVNVLARVSEGPEMRQKLKQQIAALLPKTSRVEILCAYKPGLSWLMDSVAPQLKGKHAASIKIEFKKNEDPTGMRVMYSSARWVQELYPVDELLSRELAIPLGQIQFDETEPASKLPTYRVRAFDAAGKEIFTQDFNVTTVERAYNGVMPSNTNACRWTRGGCGWNRRRTWFSIRESPPTSKHSGITTTKTRFPRYFAPSSRGPTASCVLSLRRRSTRSKSTST